MKKLVFSKNAKLLFTLLGLYLFIMPFWNVYSNKVNLSNNIHGIIAIILINLGAFAFLYLGFCTVTK